MTKGKGKGARGKEKEEREKTIDKKKPVSLMLKKNSGGP